MVKDKKNRFKGNSNWAEGWGWALYEAKDPKGEDFKQRAWAATYLPRNDLEFLSGAFPNIDESNSLISLRRRYRPRKYGLSISAACSLLHRQAMILHTGHLAIETHGSVIAEKMLELLGKIKHQ